MQLLIAATLAATSCSDVSAGPCEAKEEDFTLDPQITPARLQELLSDFGETDPAKLDCDAVCSDIWDLHTWFMGQVTTYQRAQIVAAQRASIAGLPALAAAQSRAAPPALALPDAQLATHFAMGLARAA